jgi:hypothetical protein
LRDAGAKIEAHQVASVRGSEQASGASTTPGMTHNNASSAMWRVDLPVADARGHQALQLRVEREPRGSLDEFAPPSWIIQMTIQPPG